MTDCNTQEDLNMIPVAFICGEIFKKHRFLKRFMAQSSVINFFSVVLLFELRTFTLSHSNSSFLC
jgi:hypothetical protein